MFGRRRRKENDPYLPCVLMHIDDLYDDSMQRITRGVAMYNERAIHCGEAQAEILLELRDRIKKDLK